MDAVLLVKALIMGVVEGLTEFLPISSTGHLILVGDLLKFLEKDQRDLFEVFIQLGAILAVVWEYRHKLIRVLGSLGSDPVSRALFLNVMIAFIPAAVLGVLLGIAMLIRVQEVAMGVVVALIPGPASSCDRLFPRRPPADRCPKVRLTTDFVSARTILSRFGPPKRPDGLACAKCREGPHSGPHRPSRASASIACIRCQSDAVTSPTHSGTTAFALSPEKSAGTSNLPVCGSYLQRHRFSQLGH
jgi:hypothetical protein